MILNDGNDGPRRYRVHLSSDPITVPVAVLREAPSDHSHTSDREHSHRVHRQRLGVRAVGAAGLHEASYDHSLEEEDGIIHDTIAWGRLIFT